MLSLAPYSGHSSQNGIVCHLSAHPSGHPWYCIQNLNLGSVMCVCCAFLFFKFHRKEISLFSSMINEFCQQVYMWITNVTPLKEENKEPKAKYVRNDLPELLYLAEMENMQPLSPNKSMTINANFLIFMCLLLFQGERESCQFNSQWNNKLFFFGSLFFLNGHSEPLYGIFCNVWFYSFHFLHSMNLWQSTCTPLTVWSCIQFWNLVWRKRNENASPIGKTRCHFEKFRTIDANVIK